MGLLKLIFILAFVGLAFKLSYRGMRDGYPSFNLKAGSIGIALILAAFMLVGSIGFVTAGTRGIVLRFGAPTGRVLQEGIYVVTPFAERVAIMSVQTEAYEADASAASYDLQDVHTKVTVNYALDPAEVVEVFRTLRYNYEIRIIKPAVQEAVKAATAKFKAEELITKREAIKEAIEQNLRLRLDSHGIILDTVSITDFDFSKEFNDAIEAKVTATQKAQEAERNLERVKFEAQQKIEQAKAEAESLRLQRQNISKDLIELRRIEAMIIWIGKWDGHLPQVVTPGLVPMFDLNQQITPAPAPQGSGGR